MYVYAYVCMYISIWGFPGGSAVGNLPANAGDTQNVFDLWVSKSPWRRKWQPTPIFLPGESQGQRSLAGYSPWNRRVGHNWACMHSKCIHACVDTQHMYLYIYTYKHTLYIFKSIYSHYIYSPYIFSVCVCVRVCVRAFTLCMYLYSLVFEQDSC